MRPQARSAPGLWNTYEAGWPDQIVHEHGIYLLDPPATPTRGVKANTLLLHLIDLVLERSTGP